jgi:poly(hydroxyalkanoate) depolymerase family esterase
VPESRWRAAGALLLSLLALAGATADRPANGLKRGMLGQRAYRIYIPTRAVEAPDVPLPLVVALHGCWQTPEDFAAGTRLNTVAERRGLFVLYPVQSHRDNPSRCWNWFEPANLNGGEVAEILALIDHIGRERRVAGDHVIALGLSAGGFLAVNLACAAPHVLSGVGVASAGPYRCGVGVTGSFSCMRGLNVDGEASAAACRGAMGGRARPVRASLWHGTEDTVVNPGNLEALALMFARVDGVAASSSDRREGAQHTIYRDAQGRALVESWLVPGMGHAWSGGDVRGSQASPSGPSATERMLDFLLGPSDAE